MYEYNNETVNRLNALVRLIEMSNDNLDIYTIAEKVNEEDHIEITVEIQGYLVHINPFSTVHGILKNIGVPKVNYNTAVKVNYTDYKIMNFDGVYKLEDICKIDVNKLKHIIKTIVADIKEINELKNSISVIEEAKMNILWNYCKTDVEKNK